MKLYQMTAENMGIFGTECAHALVRSLVHDGLLTKEAGDRIEMTRVIIYREPGFLTRLWKRLFPEDVKENEAYPIVVDLKSGGVSIATKDVK
jgi:hypothetical protein